MKFQDWLKTSAAQALSPRLLCSLVVVVGCILYGLMRSQQFAGAVIDDAYITYRHSLNWVEGQGFTCNPGERLEGTSSFLYGLLIAIPLLFGIEPYAASVVLNSLFFAACIGFCAATSSKLATPDQAGPLAGASALIVASSTSLAFYVHSGLETVFAAFLVALSLWLWAREQASAGRGSSWVLPLIALSWTRPEGFGYFLVFWTIFSFARIVKARASVDSLKRSGKDVLLFCGGWFPLLLFRRVYFGEWVPNSVLAKSDEMRWTEQWASPWFEQELARRGEIAIAFIQAHPVIVGLAVAGLLLARRRVPAGMGIGLLAACAVVLMWLGHDWMPYDRLFVITVVPLTVAACAGISALFFQKSQRLGGSNAPSYLVAGALVLICVQENHRQDEYFRHRKEFTNLLANLGTRLAPVLKPGDVLATELAGIVPYHLRAKSIDMLGLCDRHIALHGDHQESFGKRDLEHVIAQEPDFYLFLAAFDAVPLFEHPDFAPRQARYRVIVTEDYLRFKPGEPPLLLIREDFPRLPEVLDRLGAHTVSFREELKRLGHLQ